MSNVIFFGVVIAVVVVAVLDGISVFYAVENVNDVTMKAANVASSEWRLYANLTRAENAGFEFCESSGLEVIEVRQVRELSTGAFSVTCAKTADTYVFKYIPGLKDLTRQVGTSVSYDSV